MLDIVLGLAPKFVLGEYPRISKGIVLGIALGINPCVGPGIAQGITTGI